MLLYSVAAILPAFVFNGTAREYPKLEVQYRVVADRRGRKLRPRTWRSLGGHGGLRRAWAWSAFWLTTPEFLRELVRLLLRSFA